MTNNLNNESPTAAKPSLAEVLAKIDELLQREYTVRSQTLDSEIRNESGAAIRALLTVKSFAEGE